MLSIYDWLRRCRNGAELIAILEYAHRSPDLFPGGNEIGPPVSAFSRPCGQCGIYSCLVSSGMTACKTCIAIQARCRDLGFFSRHAAVVWGAVSHIPRGMEKQEGFYADKPYGLYVQDEKHFLMVTDRRHIKDWVQELLLYHGTDLKGLIQIFPTCGEGKRGTMGDVLCRAIYLDARFPPDRLRIRFFSSPFQVYSPQIREEKGLLTFEVTEFLHRLEMARIFRSLLRSEAQDMLRELTEMENPGEEQFYWGRFMGYIEPEGRDMLDAWKFRQWPVNQIRLLYELGDYVVYET